MDPLYNSEERALFFQHMAGEPNTTELLSCNTLLCR